MPMDRIRLPRLRDRIMSPEAAAALFADGMTVGMSGFTRAGDCKAVPFALAERAARQGSAMWQAGLRPDAPKPAKEALQELQELLANPAALPDLTGCKINHKMFGAGTVRPAEGQFMVIDFNGTLKKFSYTASMNSGYLSAEDPNVEARLQAYQDYNKDKDRLEKELKNLKAELVKL